MAIQMRRGMRADFDPQKMLPGEWAVAIDPETENQIIWMCFSAGVVKRMGTYEDFSAQIEDATEEVKNYYLQLLEEAQQRLQSETEGYIQGKIDETWIPALENFVEQASQSQLSAAESAANADSSAKAAESARDTAKGYSDAAKTAKTDAESARDTAQGYLTDAETAKNAAESASTSAEQSKDAAAASETEAGKWAKLSESYARGGTDAEGRAETEDTDNAKYYYEQARTYAESLTSALKPMGNIEFAGLTDLEPKAGDFYNVTDEFQSDERFTDGGENTYPAGTDVYYTSDGHWNAVQGAGVAGVKGAKEGAYRKGLVDISPENIGAAASEHNHDDAYLKKTGPIPEDLLKQLFLYAHPVGSIFMTTSATNPGNTYGGTWAAWGSGRVPVGVDATQTEFTGVEKTGGNKLLQAHGHSISGTITIPAHGHTASAANTTATMANAGGTGSVTFRAFLNTNGEGIQGASGIVARTTAVWSGSHSGYEARTITDGKRETLSFTTSHAHTMNAHGHTITVNSGGGGNATHNLSVASNGSGDGQNLQPYITCYMWKRTA